MNEIDAVAFLLERGFGFDQYNMVGAYQSSATNLVDGVHHGFLVQFGSDIGAGSFEERSFQTSREAAQFFIEKKKECD
jgi:hypothetical protein